MYHLIFIISTMLATPHRPPTTIDELVQATHPSAFSCSVSKLDGHYSTTCEFSCDDKTVAACETPHGGTLTTCKIGDVTVTLPFSPC